MKIMSPDEIREWIKFAVILIGSSIALRTYIISQRQRRLDNSLKLIDLFFDNLEENDIEEWKQIFHASSESSGAKPGYFNSKCGQQIPFDSLFSEGPEDNGAIDRIIQQIDLISLEILNGTVDARYVYSRIGQIMETTHKWLGSSDNSVVHMHFPSFSKVMRKKQSKFNSWPSKTYVYCG